MTKAIVLFGVASVALFGAPHSEGSNTEFDDISASLKRAIVRHYANVVHATYEDALTGVRKLGAEVESFLTKPSQSGMARVRLAWIEARRPYLQTEVFRFYDGPIDEVEGFINAWPIDENLIDYVADDAEAGIINEPEKYPSITAELITGLNEKRGERSITTGFHAIEFLLWGQDQSAVGPGERPAEDYVSKNNAPRRCTYLRVATQLLIDHLRQVAVAWAPGPSNNYRAQFIAMDSDAAIGRMLKGMGSLSGPELAGERLTVAYQTKEQEDEHSCFSDTTHLDLEYDALGIENVYFGRYARTDGSKINGPAIYDLLRRQNPALAGKLAGEITAGVRAARAIPKPFDQAVLGEDTSSGRRAVRRAIQAFQAQSGTIAKAAAALNIPLNL